MRVKVFRYMYTRHGGASRTYQKGVVRVPGEEIDVHSTITGEEIDGNNVWYFDGVDKYYWSGGVNDAQAPEPVLGAPAPTAPIPTPAIGDYTQYINARFDGQKLLSPIDYNLLLTIPPAIKQSKGRGVTVAILDHPIKKDLVLQHDIVRPVNVGDPANGHGTFIAGLIAGASGVLGVAPDVTIVEMPLRGSDGFLVGDDVLKQLFDFLAAQQQPVILNISQDLPGRLKEMMSVLQHVLIVAAAGTDTDLLKPGLIFPANQANAIAVGAISQSFYQANPAPPFDQKLDLIFPDLNYVSDSIGAQPFHLDTGVSLATAIVSGMAALLFAAGEVNKNFDGIRQKLEGISKPYSSPGLFNSLNPIIPPR